MQPKYLLGGANAYSLSSDEVDRRSNQLFSRYRTEVKAARERGHRYLVVSVDGSDQLADIGRTIESSVFETEYGGVDNRPEKMSAEFGPYEDRSVFFLAIELGSEKVVGSLRGVVSWAGVGPMCKTMLDCLSVESYGAEFENTIDLRDSAAHHLRHVGVLGNRGMSGAGIDRRFLEEFHAMQLGDLIFDMATVVVPESHRDPEAGQKLGELLYAASYRAAVIIEAKHAVTFIHAGLLGHFRDGLGMPWEDLGGLGSTQYTESDPFLSQPAYLSLNRFAATISREQFRQKLDRPEKFGKRHAGFINVLAASEFEDLFLL